MYIDSQLTFNVDQPITVSAPSTNVIDMGLGDSGRSEDLAIFCRVSQVFNNLTSLGIKLQTATDAAFTTPVDLPVQTTDLLASLTANSEHFKVEIPQGAQRYLRMYYTVNGTAPTTGMICAYIISERQANN